MKELYFDQDWTYFSFPLDFVWWRKHLVAVRFMFWEIGIRETHC